MSNPRVDPGPEANVGGVGLGAIEILRPQLADEGKPRAPAASAGQREPEQPQRVVLVVGVVEERDVVGVAHRGDDLAADQELAVDGADRGQTAGLRGGRRRHAEHAPREDRRSQVNPLVATAPGPAASGFGQGDGGGPNCRTTGRLSSWLLSSSSAEDRSPHSGSHRMPASP